MVSSSAIIALSVQAGSLNDETSATRACQALPWLYTTGWMRQYGSLSAESYRMYQTTRAVETMRGGTVTAIDMYIILAMLLMLNWAITISWTLVDPLVWIRYDQGTSLGTDLGGMTYESYGRCSSNHLAWWVGSILALQFLVVVGTNYLLYNILNVSDRYQESKYVFMASAYACEFLIVGIPILIAVGENAVEASYIVLVCIVGLGDLGILLMIFVPKIIFSRKGLSEGVSVGQSIFKLNVSREQLQDRSRSRQANNSDVRELEQISEENHPAKDTEKPNSNPSEAMSGGSDNAHTTLEHIVKEGVKLKPCDSSELDPNESKKQEDGALLINLTLQW